MNQASLRSTVRRILYFALIATMIFGLLSCASSSKDGSDPTATPVQSQTGDQSNDNTTGDETPEADEPPIDLGGYEFVGLTAWGMEHSTLNPKVGESTRDDMTYEFMENLRNTYNFTTKLNYIALDNFTQEIIALSMSGMKAADYILLDFGRFMNLYIAGILMDINETTAPNIDLSNTEKWKPSVTEDGTLRGKVYGFYDQPTPASVVFFNSTLLAEKGCTDPYELYREDKWNWEEFAKLIEYMTINESGGADPDIYGLGAQTWGTYYFETALISSNGGNPIKNEAGGFRFALEDNDAQEALLFARSIYENKWYIPNLPRDAGSYVDLFRKRKVAFYLDGFGVVGWTDFKEMEDDFGVLPMPKGPNADDYNSLTVAGAIYCMTVATKPEDYFASSFIFNAITEPLPPTGDPTIDDPLYNLRYSLLRDETAVEVYQYLLSRIVTTQLYSYPDLQSIVLAAISSCTQAGSTTPKAAMEAIADQAQAMIDDFFTIKEPE